MRRVRAVAPIVALVALAGCASAPRGAYFPSPGDPETAPVARALWRAARAAGDEPDRYSFALIRALDAAAYTAEDATFYFSLGLARQPAHVRDALIAHEVAHEVLGHVGKRRALSLGMTAGFTVLGLALPGASLVDLVANPLVVRAHTRDQEIAADLRAVEILRSMGYAAPRRALADALREAARLNGPARSGWLSTEPSLADRLSALEPLETAPVAASTK